MDSVNKSMGVFIGANIGESTRLYFDLDEWIKTTKDFKESTKHAREYADVRVKYQGKETPMTLAKFINKLEL